MTSYYTLQEEIGREKAIKLLGAKTPLTIVEDQFAPYDLSGTTLTNNFYVEIKDRQCSSTAYDEDLMEYSKAKAMKNADKTGLRYYLCFFNDGVARLYHLNKINLEDVFIENVLCPSSTGEDKGLKEKICYLLPIELAKTYKY